MNYKLINKKAFDGLLEGAANMGAATERKGGIQLFKNIKDLSPNNPKFQHWHYYFTMIFGFDASENDEDMLNEYLWEYIC